MTARQTEREFARLLMFLTRRITLVVTTPRCNRHPAFEPDNCPGCSTHQRIGR